MNPSLAIVFGIMALSLFHPITGEGGHFNKIENPLGDLSIDSFLKKMWDFIVDKIICGIISVLSWVENALISVYHGIQNMINKILVPVSSTTGLAVHTLNVILGTAYILVLMFLVRLWVLALDVAPIA